MMPAPASGPGLSFSLAFISIVLVPLALAGMVLIDTGLGRARSAAHAMTTSLLIAATAVVTYFVFGFKVQGYPLGAETVGVFPGQGPAGWFLGNVSVPGAWLCASLGMLSAGLTAAIPVGAAADRWRILPACASTVLLAGCAYPLFARFAWHAGLPFGALKFLDAGGSGVIHVTGGLAALSIAWLLGPRRGKYSDQGLPAAIPAHNAVFVLFGCMLAWAGWLGLNSAGAIIYSGMPPEESGRVLVNTTLSACAAALASAAMTRIRFRKPDASLIANGWMAGLVSSSAGCATLKPATAVLTGLVAGGIVVFSVEAIEFTLKVDDPCGAISVHAVSGTWGLLAAGIFSAVSGQLMAQLVGVATLLGLIFPLTYVSNWLLHRFIPYRVSPEGERQGLDLHELGADAYPEFVVHTDEFIQR